MSSKGFRERYDYRAAEPLFAATATAIDRLRSIYDALKLYHEQQDVTQTREARAVGYKQQYAAATAKVAMIREDMAQRFTAHEQSLRAAAWERSGLHAPLDKADAQELRQYLARLDPKARDKAVAKAIDSGDRAVLLAILYSPSPALVGPLSQTSDSLVKQFIAKTNPEFDVDLRDLEGAQTHLRLALEGFDASAQNLREPAFEERGEQSAARAAEARQALEDALSGAGLEA
jgi:hypothetical protein